MTGLSSFHPSDLVSLCTLRFVQLDFLQIVIWGDYFSLGLRFSLKDLHLLLIGT